MSLRSVVSEVAFPSAGRAAGTYDSGPIAAAGTATHALLLVHSTAVSGLPTLNASLEESTDGSSWTAVTGSAITQVTTTGNAMAHAQISKNYVRVVSTVGGTSVPSVTYSVTVWIAT